MSDIKKDFRLEPFKRELNAELYMYSVKAKDTEYLWSRNDFFGNFINENQTIRLQRKALNGINSTGGFPFLDLWETIQNYNVALLNLYYCSETTSQIYNWMQFWSVAEVTNEST